MKASSRSAQPSRKEFLALARAHTLVPVCRTLMADLETPVSAFLRAAWPERECFLLESVEGGEQVGRYTFIGLTPFKRIVARGREIAITEGRKTTRIEGDIFAVLRDALGGHKPARLPGLPPFTAGAVGFFAYDAVRQIERLPAQAKDELGIPDACLLFFDEVLAFDHVRKEIWLVVTADVSRGKAGAAYDRAVKRLDKLEKRLAQAAACARAQQPAKAAKLKVKHRTAKKDYIAAVERTKEYIAAGDVFQVVLSQRFDVEPGVDSFQVYRALRTVNPSPYMFFLRFAPEGPLGRSSRRPDKLVQKVKRIGDGRAGRLVARAAGARAQGQGGVPAHRRHAAARRHRGRRSRARRRDDARRKGARRARDAGRPGPQRCGPRQPLRQREGRQADVRRALLARDAHRELHRRPAAAGAHRRRRAARLLPCRERSPARPKCAPWRSSKSWSPRGAAPTAARFSTPISPATSTPASPSAPCSPSAAKGSVQAGAGIVADSVPELEHQESINKAQAVIRAIERAREL